jgi:hypothetical protein
VKVFILKILPSFSWVDVAGEEPNAESEEEDADNKETGTCSTSCTVWYWINFLIFTTEEEEEEMSTVRRSEKELQFEEFIRR